jgi:hypothetical protein
LWLLWQFFGLDIPCALHGFTCPGADSLSGAPGLRVTIKGETVRIEGEGQVRQAFLSGGNQWKA